MNEKLQEFIALVHTGKLSLDGKTLDKVEVNDPTNLYQCFDLSYAWCDFLQIPRDTIRHLRAYQIYTEPNDLTVKYFEMIPNTPGGVPQVGDIVVFSTDIGGISGHVSIATGEGDTNSFKSLDQNFGDNKLCRIVTHTYTALKGMGWLRPRVQELSDDTKKALSLLEEYRRTGGYGNLEGAMRVLLGIANDIVAVKNELVEYKTGEVLRIESAVSSALVENDKNWQKDMDSANKTIKDLNLKIELLFLNEAQKLDWNDIRKIVWNKLFVRR